MLNKKQSWSFAAEWKEHAASKQEKTWDMTAAERLEYFYDETMTDPSFIRNKTVLDAGCGNGQLTKAITDAGARVVGIDMQPHLPASLSNDQLQFVQASFDDPPFHEKSFDIIIANGSIHHTPDTRRSFRSLSKLVKENGRLYVWVYKKPEKVRDRFLLWWLDLLRFFISRFPAALQKFSVNMITFFFYVLSRIRKGENSKRTKAEIRINVYDAFTPRYRFYHSTIAVTKWFIDEGFDIPLMTHVYNKYGFGMVGIKPNR